MNFYQGFKTTIERLDFKLPMKRQTVILLLLIALSLDEIQRFDQTQFIAGVSIILIAFIIAIPKDYFVRNRILLTCIFIGAASFFLKISTIERWILLIGTSFVLSYPYRQLKSIGSLIRIIIPILNFYFLLIVIYKFINDYSNYTLQFLSFGYDNALHFSLYKSFRISSWYPFLDLNNWSSNFSLFRNYPSAQAAIFSFLADIFVGKSDDPIRNLSAFFLVIIIFFILMIFFIYRILQIQNSKRSPVNIFLIISAVATCYAFGGIFLTNGFPPYQFGLFVLLIWLNTLNLNQNNFSNIYLIGGLCFFMILNSPALLFCILIPCVILVSSELVALFREKRLSLLLVRSAYLAGMAIITVLANFELSSKFGWRQILAGGGIQPPNIYLSGFLSMVVCAVLWMERRSILKCSLLQVLISSGMSFLVLATITITFTGSIQYYAIKQWYLCLVIISIVIFRFAFLKNSKVFFQYVGRLMVGIVILVPAIYASVYTGGFMGTFPKAVMQLMNQEAWAQNPVNSNLQLSLLSGISKNEYSNCIIFRIKNYDSDLNSRWANSLLRTESLSENCFKGYWNSSQLSDAELLERLSNIDENFLIIGNQPVGFKTDGNLSANVELKTIKP